MKSFKRILVFVFVLAIVLAFSGCAETKKAKESDFKADEVESFITSDAGLDIGYDEFVKNYIFSIENLRKANNLKNYEETSSILNREVGEKSYDMMIREQIASDMIEIALMVKYAEDSGIKIDNEEVQTFYDNFQNYLLQASPVTIEYYKLNGIDEEFIKNIIKKQSYGIKIREKITKEVNDEIATDSSRLDNEIVKVKARHILVNKIEEAEQIVEKIKSGEDFGELAKALSVDKSSGQQGGDLGYFGRGAMIKEFEEAAFSLEKGTVSEPVKSMFGYHIIKVDDKQSYADLKKSNPESQELELIRNSQISNIISQKLVDLSKKLKEGKTFNTNEEMLRKPIDLKFPEIKPEVEEKEESDTGNKTEEKTEDNKGEKSEDTKDEKSEDKTEEKNEDKKDEKNEDNKENEKQ